MITEAIKMIRESKAIGRGSCSVIDECYTDNQLEQQFAEMTRLPQMVGWAFGTADMHAEQEANAYVDSDASQTLSLEAFQRQLSDEWKVLFP